MLKTMNEKCAVEMPVELWVDQQKVTTFMCTPENLDDLAVGHLLVRGMLDSYNEIKTLHVDTTIYRIDVTTECGLHPSIYSVPEFVLSGCSSVAEFSDNIYKLKTLSKGYEINLDQVVATANDMVDHANIYHTTGGVHAAIIHTPKKTYLREDIGRHNAVDKAIGAIAIVDGDFSNTFVCTTGRISLDMILKSAAVGIPIVVSLKYPSDMGIRLAKHYNISIVGRILSEQPIVYTSHDRIITHVNQ